jgi:hypothetical protein
MARAPLTLRSRRTRLAMMSAWLLALAATCTACGGAEGLVDEEPLKPQPQIKGIILFPVAVMTPEADSIAIAHRTVQVADLVSRTTGLPVLSLYDFDVFKEPDELRAASADTDLVTRLGSRTALDGWVGLHVLITENRAANTRDIVDIRSKDPAKHKTYRKGNVESLVRIEITLRGAMRGKMLALRATRARDNPFDGGVEGDPRPGLKKLIDKAVVDFFAANEEALAATWGRRVPLSGALIENPAHMMTFGTNRFPSLAKRLEGKDPIELEAAVGAVWDRVSPTTPIRMQGRISRAGGVGVLEDVGPLKKGDVIIRVDDKNVHAIHQLDRLLQARAAAGATLEVIRNYKPTKVPVRWEVQPRPDA